MRKINKIIATLGIVTLLVPGIGLAHNNEKKDKDEGNSRGRFNWILNWNKNKQKTHSGTVTAVTTASTTGFTLLAENGTSFTVNTQNAKITKAFSGDIVLSGIHVNDKATVKGSVDGTVITAKTVVVTPANTHKASGGGKVTAVSGNSFTVQQNNHGIVTSFTVNTNASTTIVSATTSTTTIASVQVGSKVRVKGLWDEILNVLNAIKVKIW